MLSKLSVDQSGICDIRDICGKLHKRFHMQNLRLYWLEQEQFNKMQSFNFLDIPLNQISLEYHEIRNTFMLRNSFMKLFYQE